MARFMSDEDYDYKIRIEITKLLDDSNDRTKLKIAEDTAIATIRMYIGGRFDVDTVFGVAGTDRNQFIIDLVISIALYKLYQQRGVKDTPTHRQNEYDDAMEWLKLAGKGEIPVADLPGLIFATAEEGDVPGDFQLNSRTATNWQT